MLISSFSAPFYWGSPGRQPHLSLSLWKSIVLSSDSCQLKAKSQFCLLHAGELRKATYTERECAMLLSEKAHELDCPGSNPVSTATCFQLVNKLFSLWYLQLWKGGNNTTYIIGLLWGLNGWVLTKDWQQCVTHIMCLMKDLLLWLSQRAWWGENWIMCVKWLIWT